MPTTAPSHAASVTTTPGPAGPAPVAPGTYRYLQTGSTTVSSGTTTTSTFITQVAPQGTLVVSASTGGAQQWVRSVDASTSTTTVLAFNAGGIFVQSETVPVLGGTCTFSAPLADPPWPLAVGRSFSGQASCNGQSTGTLSVTGSVSGMQSLTVDGRSVPTYAIGTILTLAGTDLKVTEVDWYAPSLRLPVQTQIVATGSATLGKSKYAVNSNIGYLLASATPS